MPKFFTYENISKPLSTIFAGAAGTELVVASVEAISRDGGVDTGKLVIGLGTAAIAGIAAINSKIEPLDR